MHSPDIDSISRPLLRMFARLQAEPDRWFAVPELVELAGASKATVYRRCGNLVAARVLTRRRANDQAEFQLRPDWESAPLGVQLSRRVMEGDAADMATKSRADA